MRYNDEKRVNRGEGKKAKRRTGETDKRVSGRGAKV